jgi:hypothetical protein
MKRPRPYHAIDRTRPLALNWPLAGLAMRRPKPKRRQDHKPKPHDANGQNIDN